MIQSFWQFEPVKSTKMHRSLISKYTNLIVNNKVKKKNPRRFVSTIDVTFDYKSRLEGAFVLHRARQYICIVYVLATDIGTLHARPNGACYSSHD